MKYKILRTYATDTGKSPFFEWLKTIKDSVIKARILRRLDRLEFGHYGDYKDLGDGIYELRLQFGAGYRVYCADVDNVIIILLCGGNKSSQKKDIKIAKRYWRELKEKCHE